MKSAIGNSLVLTSLLIGMVMVALPGAVTAQDPEYTDSFMIEECTFLPRGANPYMILDSGHRLVLEGVDEGELVRLVITVLPETRIINGVETRVIEERETADGELVEVSRNFFSICKQNSNVFYFGEEVDIYEGGVIVSHEGAWTAGVDGALAGVIMPGVFLIGARYFQEVAPEVAMDRAEIESIAEVVETPAGMFQDCLKIRETTPLEPGAEDFKFYAPGIGLIKDGVLELVEVSEPEELELDVSLSGPTISSLDQRRIRIGNIHLETPEGNPVGTYFGDYEFNLNTFGFDLVGTGMEE